MKWAHIQDMRRIGDPQPEQVEDWLKLILNTKLGGLPDARLKLLEGLEDAREAREEAKEDREKERSEESAEEHDTTKRPRTRTNTQESQWFLKKRRRRNEDD